MSHLRLRPWRLLVAGSAVLVALTGCGGGAGQQSPTSKDPAGGVGEEITVFAAASLTGAFTEIAKYFEQDHPGVTVRFNFAGSSTLVQQVTRGAPADVFASASPQQMRQAVEAGEVARRPAVFVANTLQIVVPAGNPARVTGLADFGKRELDIALCAEQVPCGTASRKALQAAGVTPAPDTLEENVKAVLTKVKLGEVDAGLVYRTDVLAATDVEGIDFPEADQAVNEYLIAVLADASNAEGARVFVDYVLSARGKAVLGRYGFRTDVE